MSLDNYVDEVLKLEPFEAVDMFIRDCIKAANASETDKFMEYYALVCVYITKYQKELLLNKEDISYPPHEVSHTIIKNYLGSLLGKILNNKNAATFEKTFRMANAYLNNELVFEMPDGDVEKIQVLINQLRDEITNTTVLPYLHKERLLRRLEKLQSELHKKMSDYDRVYGIAVDCIALVKKFGESVQPITKLVNEITRLVLVAHGRAYELPSDERLMLSDNSINS